MRYTSTTTVNLGACDTLKKTVQQAFTLQPLPTDYALFDFPIPSGSPHELYLTVMDGSGNPISATFAIFHKMGDAGDAPCHHVVLQGG